MSSNKTVKSTTQFARRVFSNRLGQLLFIIHLITLIYAYVDRGSPIKHPIHFYYESALFKALVLLDLPALILSSIVAYPVVHQSSSPSIYWWSTWIDNAIVLTFTSIQWWLIGYFVGYVLRRKSYMRRDVLR